MSQTIRAPRTSEQGSAWKRGAAMTAGGTLLALGLRRRTVPGYAAALAGGWLVYRGVRGGDGREIELVSFEALEAEAEAIDVDRTLAIQASPAEVRAFLLDPANLDHVLGEAGSVETAGEDRQRWTIDTPIGYSLSWEMIQEESEDENELRWSSTGAADVEVGLTMRPAPGESGTELTVHVGFEPPGGSIGTAVLGRLDVVPYTLAGRWLRRIRSLLETGELPTLEAEPQARPETREA